MMARILSVAIMATVFLTTDIWAQGSKPQSGSGDELKRNASIGTTLHEAVTESRGRVHVKRRVSQVTPEAEEVEFTGKDGKVMKALKVDGVKMKSLVASKEGTCAVAIVATDRFRTYESPWYEVHYFNSEGVDVWQAPICCSLGIDIYQQAVMSDDGSLVALRDAAAGEICEVEKKGFTAPPGCVGLRIFTGEGREIYRARQADEVSVSPRGKYVIYATNGYKDIFQLHVASGKAEKLPKPEGTRLSRVASDDGVVMYGMRKKIGPPIYRYVPGKGLEKVRD